MSRPPVIVTNDDGIGSEGLWHLAAAAAQAGFEVVVAAPAQEASGTGSAMKSVRAGGQAEITRHQLPAPAAGIPAFAVQATPAFIVFAAVRGAFGPAPKYVLAGINRGPNTGRAVLHSGTVGAAMTAAGYGLTSAAFSLDIRQDSGPSHWLTAAHVAKQILPVLPDAGDAVVLNVNVPNLPAQQLGGIRRAHLASFGAVQTTMDTATEGFLQINVTDRLSEPEPGTDLAALAAGYASLTPLRAVCELPADGLPWQVYRAAAG
ncbi:MAG: 5'/3'-nucleotidase SurE [Streptosporangiaceae bacterium]